MSGALDEALEILKNIGFEYGGRLSNHGPMAVEALSVLGRGEAGLSGSSAYRKLPEERSARISPPMYA